MNIIATANGLGKSQIMPPVTVCIAMPQGAATPAPGSRARTSGPATPAASKPDGS
jgi:hypothetical protein